MTAVADIFDRDGDGYIDYYEFVAALHPNKDAYRPTTDADKIEDEVKHQKKRGAQQGWGRFRLRVGSGEEKNQVERGFWSQNNWLGLSVFEKERLLGAGSCWGRLPKSWFLTSRVGGGRSPGKWPSASVPRGSKWSRSARTNTG